MNQIQHLDVNMTMAEVQQRFFLFVYEHHLRSKPKTAKSLGISRKSVYNMLEKFEKNHLQQIPIQIVEPTIVKNNEEFLLPRGLNESIR